MFPFASKFFRIDKQTRDFVFENALGIASCCVSCCSPGAYRNATNTGSVSLIDMA